MFFEELRGKTVDFEERKRYNKTNKIIDIRKG